MLIGYMRVSKCDGTQNLDLQKDALISHGVDPNRIYQDMASGKRDSRPGLNECLRALQPGNTLIVWKLDRLGRDLKHLVNLVEELNKKEVNLKILSGMAFEVDTRSAMGKLMFNFFAMLSEFERDLIIDRTMAGLASARARGRMGGRPRKMDVAKLKIAMAAMSDRTAVATDVAKILGLTTACLYAYVNADGSLKEAGSRLLGQT